MYNYFIPKAIIQQFSSFHTTFCKKTLQTNDIGNFVICLISNSLIGLTVCYFVIPKISSRPDHWCQKVFIRHFGSPATIYSIDSYIDSDCPVTHFTYPLDIQISIFSHKTI